MVLCLELGGPLKKQDQINQQRETIFVSFCPK